ncbi:N-methylhydantoinase A/acetone carboxylase, beta subunit [Halogeometricum borinquense DSM 11551]|uniref:N-methylhydantoinase A/acetone carboxylase, beta subunit n=1 Tax=Halogeometricum borinquense (strain ATCC 700274 / DSM 11551 / JCM 10706 / KCTC 4070 / PR3) TaxID=469382 RepID=E4NUQ4_HALBP|nr:hydantoinase/oxoprolinase family protein [Halogeometricum borinquense]ADQ68774.1 N-methylhydantoinase A/acetone carboxylase, beta subunit [Halogeometricum borinquense DSM 11551]ELY25663.1 N-methylhydantoinase A/acetone carboxylase, beta subunit [Halogeometricum borinquense DSM 11551]
MSRETRIGVDVGGTFTDVALLTPENELVTAKVPSTDDQSVGVVRGFEKACDEAEIDPSDVDAFTHAMTVSVNALLEENGAKTALVTTEGFRDVLEIGRQARPDLYDVTADKPAPLVPRRRRFEVTERATIDGVETTVDESEVRSIAENIRASDAESVAVSLLHAYQHPENEQIVADVLREELDVPVSASHEVLAEFREYERTSTTVVDAYVTPAIDAYLGRLEERAAEMDVPVPQIMQANGGIAPASTVREHAVTTTMSGPAAGVVGAAETATSDDLDGLVTFDMGGTSSDVSLVRDGEVERTTDAEINERPIKTPMVDVNTVGAGGGSIAWVDAGNALRVGPRSSGANPGPACYGRGGTEPTVTDANVVLGYIGGSSALGGELSLDVDAAHDALANLADEAGLDGALAAARGVYRVANANMTRAIRAVTVERGHDPREFGLVAFGGAGPMHAAALAESLDVGTVVVPRACGVLSAYGLLAADQKHDSVRTLRSPLAETSVESVEAAYDELESDVLADVQRTDAATVQRAADLRYDGQSFELTVPVDETFDADVVEGRFHEAHENAYGYRLSDPVELVNVRSTAVVERGELGVTYRGTGEAQKDTRSAFFDGEFHETPVYEREGLGEGATVEGPVILEQNESTVVVPPTWTGTVRADGTLVMTAGGDGE